MGNIMGQVYNSKCLNKTDMNQLKYFVSTEFMLQWSFSNNSPNNANWPIDVKFKQIAGDEFGVKPFAINKIIDNGHTMDIFISFKAPDQPGQYKGFFRLCHGPNEIEFGEKVWIDLTAEKASRKDSGQGNEMVKEKSNPLGNMLENFKNTFKK